MSTQPVMEHVSLRLFRIDFEEWWMRPSGDIAGAVAEILLDCGVKGVSKDQARGIAADLQDMFFTVVPDPDAAYAQVMRGNGITVHMEEPDATETAAVDPNQLAIFTGGESTR